MIDTLDPISAVTAPDPYPYYAQLSAERPYFFDEALNLWVASSIAKVLDVLADRSLSVRPLEERVPKALLNTPVGEVFAQLVRFSDGAYHDRVRASLSDLFARFDTWSVVAKANLAARAWIDALDHHDPSFVNNVMFGVPALAVAALLGLPPSDQTLGWTKQFVGALRANATGDAIALGSDGTRALAAALGDARLDERTSNAIGLLFQSYDATAGLIGNTLLHLRQQTDVSDMHAFVERVIAIDPSVHNTRRFGSGGVTLVLLAAAQMPFGASTHGCPARSLATEITVAACSYLLERGLRLDHLRFDGYVPSPNCRIPRLGVKVPSTAN